MLYNSPRTLAIFFVIFIIPLTISCGKGETEKTQSLVCNNFKFEFPQVNSELSGKITAKGTHNCVLSDHIWIVLHDGYGYYLQSPEVSLFNNGTWEHDAISLGGGIKSIQAILVNEAGHEIFSKRVQKHDFGQLDMLPTGYIKLASIPIRN